MPLKEVSLEQRAMELARHATGIAGRLHDIAGELDKLRAKMPGDTERELLVLLIKSIRAEIHAITGR